MIISCSSWGGVNHFYFVHTQYTVENDYVMIIVLSRISNTRKCQFKEVKERVLTLKGA